MVREALEKISGKKADHIPPMSYGDWIGDENAKLKKEITDNFKVWEEAAKKAEAVLCGEIDSLRAENAKLRDENMKLRKAIGEEIAASILRTFSWKGKK